MKSMLLGLGYIYYSTLFCCTMQYVDEHSLLPRAVQICLVLVLLVAPMFPYLIWATKLEHEALRRRALRSHI